MSEDKWRKIPSDEIIAQAAELEVFDVQGGKVRFGSLYQEQKTIVVFIRMYLVVWKSSKREALTVVNP